MTRVDMICVYWRCLRCVMCVPASRSQTMRLRLRGWGGIGDFFNAAAAQGDADAGVYTDRREVMIGPGSARTCMHPHYALCSCRMPCE